MKRILMAFSVIVCLLLLGALGIRDTQPKPPLPLVQVNTEMLEERWLMNFQDEIGNTT